MDKTQILDKLRSIGQTKILELVQNLSLENAESLLTQIEQINIPTFREQQQMLLQNTHHPLKFINPFHNFKQIGDEKDANTGLQLIKEGKVGCLLIAGGQGTRLRFEEPKGMYPVSLIKKKSLFELFANKLLAAGLQAQNPLPLAIMTSPQNHEETVTFFKEHDFFGLNKNQVSFFCQGQLPLLNAEGDLFLDSKEHLAEGPDGNGSSLKHFYESGIWDSWYAGGVRLISYILIDNALADPFDAELIGYHHNMDAEVIIKCITRADPKEKVGVIVEHEDTVQVIEYSELTDEIRFSLKEDATLTHPLANISLFSFSMDFIKKISKTELLLHVAHKAVKYLDDAGKVAHPQEPNAFKFERFIFDVLPHALKVRALVYPRDKCFAPLKNAEGENSVETVRQALYKRDQEVLAEITGLEPPEFPFELSQDFYYPTPTLLEQWKGVKLQNEGYISPF